MISPVRQAAVLFLLVLACCSGRQKAIDTAERGLATAVSATKAAREAFGWYNADQQLVIARTATSRADGEAKLAAYRARRAPVFLAFAAASSALTAAASALSLAAASDADLATAIDLTARALRAALAVRDAVARLQGAPP